MDCSTLVETLLEAELFGHERGAFTGAVEAKRGRLELAGEGTIFFDEVGELPPTLQAKLLRFLEYREFSRVGSAGMLRSDARIIAATNPDLSEMARQGALPPGFVFRLKVISLRVPPLRERLEDMHGDGALFPVAHQPGAGHPGRAGGGRGHGRLLAHYSWPGNVRELINILTKAAIDSRGQVLLTDAVKNALSLGGAARPASPEILTLAEAEKQHILQVLEITRWNVTAAAQALGVSRPTLRARMARHGLARPAQS